MTTQIAIFDTGAGFLQWIGKAEDHAAAIKALHKDVGLWELSVDREEILQRAGDESVLVMDVSDEQAKALEAWADAGFKASAYPEGLPPGVKYTCSEVLEILEDESAAA